MKKTLALLLAGLMLIFSGCASKPDEPVSEKAELVIFAAASMQETLTELQPLFEANHPGVKLIFSFDSSGTLKTQIQEGALCDIFISAGQKQVDQLDIEAGEEKNPDGLDFILAGSRMNLLENRVTLCVPEGDSKVSSFDDLAALLKDGSILLCMGNSDVPVGQYTQKILQHYGLEEEALAAAGCITYASNVKEVTTQVTQGSVDAGVIYCTDAFSAGLTPVDYATKGMCGQIIYPAAVINTSLQQELAMEYLEFLQSAEAMEVFEKVGFSPVN
ncbi:MAG: molybdate ABC transporter substrate-binding protein [Lachnospiraceae bacterium]|nr:molybdate ABC transporter substrate-binding protein [Lachnospiraceae bacterium]